MTHFKIPINLTNLFIFIIIALLWVAITCTYEPFQPPEMPKFYQTINLPLADVCLPLSDLHDPTNNIYGDSLLTFKFGGTLDKVTLPDDIFVIPSMDSVVIDEDLNMDSANIKIDKYICQPLNIDSSTMSAPIEATIDQVEPTSLFSQEFEIFNKDSIPYFERVDYLTIGEGEFIDTIKNETSMDLDSVIIRMTNKKDGSLIAESVYDTIHSKETKTNSSLLNGIKVMDSIIVSISANLPGTDNNSLTVPKLTESSLTFSCRVTISDVDSVTGKPKPIKIPVDPLPLPESGPSIYRGVLGETISDTNLIRWNITNKLPLNLDMDVTFLNFYSDEGAVTINMFLERDGGTSEDSKCLDLDTLRDPTTSVVNSIIVEATIKINPGDTVTTIPLDFGGGLNGTLSISALKFKEIEGIFEESIGSFTIPSMTIRDIPEGFGDMDFKDVWLKFYIYNEIQAQADLQFQIRGYRDSKEDSLLKNTTINKATPDSSEVLTNFGFNIAPIFNMMPDSITVSGSASITPMVTFKLEAGKSFRGIDSLIVPFTMKLNNDIIFIPVKSNELSPMDETTRQRIQEGLIESGITYGVINDFPFSGRVDLLMSNFDYFPLSPDSVDSAYWWNGDTYETLFTYANAETVSIIIDTLVTIELPTRVYDNENQVKEFGGNSVIDSTMLEKIIGDEKHYIRPRIHLDSTSSYVSIQYDDEIDIVAILSLTMEAGALFGTGDSEQDTLPSDSSLKKPIIMRDADEPDLFYNNKSTDKFGLKLGKSSKENVLK